ncbi:MAG: helix-turn-helix transcriptional regulator [Bdellovibrionales bacterium]|nr:helix-turn-helix transcriptional regulator [Bdellovibrionales bacterium]
MDKFCKFLKKKRVESGLSQWDVAQKLGYSSPQFVSNWERCKCSPAIESFKGLSNLYEISFEIMVKMYLNDQKQMIYKKNRVRKNKTDMTSL